MEKITLALVITKPGHLRNGLQSILRTVPQIEVIAESHDPSVLVRMSDEIHPDLILVDAEVIEDPEWTAISKLKGEWPQTTILVLTENDKQGLQAKKAGADHFLPKGFPAAELVNLIEKSLTKSKQDEIRKSN